MMSPDDYESLSREERLRRVCALLSKAVTLACIRKQAANGESAPALVTGDQPGSEEAAGVENSGGLRPCDLALFREIHRWGEISPRDATGIWSVSRTTAHRWLSQLEKTGWLVKRGATKAARYLLTEQATSLLRQMKQIKQETGAAQVGQ